MSFQTVVSEILQNEYVLTPDNFVKMLLIYMRVQSGIPVLIMGETGKRIVHIRTHFFNEFLL
jgi:hypothetical protein